MGLQRQIQTFRGRTRSPDQVIYFEGLMTVIFISSQHFTKATKVLQKGKGMVERVNQWRQMQTMKYDACVLKTDVQKKF